MIDLGNITTQLDLLEGNAAKAEAVAARFPPGQPLAAQGGAAGWAGAQGQQNPNVRVVDLETSKLKIDSDYTSNLEKAQNIIIKILGSQHHAVARIQNAPAENGLMILENETHNSYYNTGFLQGRAPGIQSPYETVTLSANGREGWKILYRELEQLNRIYAWINKDATWKGWIQLDPAPMFFIGTYHDDLTTKSQKVAGFASIAVLAKQDVAPTIPGGLLNMTNSNGLCTPGLMIAVPGTEPMQIQMQISNKALNNSYVPHGFAAVNRVAVNETRSTGGAHAMIVSEGNPMYGPQSVVPDWDKAATVADATKTMMTPLTTNAFVYSLQNGAIQSNGRSQEQANILKAVPLTLIEQTILIGTLRGFELAGVKDGDQHRPPRAIYYTK